LFPFSGPLVEAALGAAEMAGRQIKVFAVEKNPYAVVTLLTKKEEVWHDKVDVISSDMREWKPTEDQVRVGSEICYH
jgi:protein arginine N-methyltransferase 5